MVNALNLNEITQQIQQYVRLIKQQKSSATGRIFYSSEPSLFNNDLRSNIHKLDGNNKFNIQSMLEKSTSLTTFDYATKAYEHLLEQEDKNKVVIDFMHKNNRNFDVKA